MRILSICPYLKRRMGKDKIADATLQKIIDEAELPIKLDVVEQREYVPDEASK